MYGLHEAESVYGLRESVRATESACGLREGAGEDTSTPCTSGHAAAQAERSLTLWRQHLKPITIRVLNKIYPNVVILKADTTHLGMKSMCRLEIISPER